MSSLDASECLQFLLGYCSSVKGKKLRLIDVAKSNPEVWHFYCASLNMLTWSYDVSGGFPGGIMPISVVLLGKTGQAFFLGNPFSLLRHGLPVPHSKSLLRVSCEWMTWCFCSAADVWGVGGKHGWMNLKCSVGVPSGLSGLCQRSPGLKETPGAGVLHSICPIPMYT